MRSLPPVLVVDDDTVRDALIPTPLIGQQVFNLQTGELRLWYGDGIGWQLNWAQPWGTILDVDDSHGGNSTSTEYIVLEQQFTATVGRKYRIRLETVWQASSVNWQQITVTFKMDGAAVAASPRIYSLFGDTATAHVGRAPAVQFATITGLDASLHTLAVSVLPTAVDGITSGDYSLLVEDVGPATYPVYS